MGEIRRTYSAEFKQKAVDMYIKRGMGFKTIARELSVTHAMVRSLNRNRRLFDADTDVLI